MSKDKQKETQETPLADIQFDDEISLFPEASETDTTSVDSVTTEVKKDQETFPFEEEEEEEITKEKKTEKEEEKDLSFEEEEEEDKTKDKQDDNFYKNLLLDLKDQGIIEAEIGEDDEIDKDKFFEYHDNEVDNRVTEALEGFMEELDDEGKAFLKFKKESGGSTKDFLETYQNISSVPKVDSEDPKSYDKFLRYYYKTYESLEDEDIDDKLEWLEEKEGRKEKYAKKYDTKVQADQEANKEKLSRDATERKKDLDDAKAEFKEDFDKLLNEKDEIKNFKFSAKEKKELSDFVLKPSVKVGKNKYATGLQASLKEAFNDKEKLAVLAKLLKSDFDVSSIERSKKTEASKSAKEAIRTSRTGVKVRNSGSSTKRQLADFFN